MHHTERDNKSYCTIIIASLDAAKPPQTRKPISKLQAKFHNSTLVVILNKIPRPLGTNNVAKPPQTRKPSQNEFMQKPMK